MLRLLRRKAALLAWTVLPWLSACSVLDEGGFSIEPSIKAGVEGANLFPEVPYVRTADDVVQGMLDLAAVGPNDHVIDLGCGDGQILIAAARRGASGLGVDIDPYPLQLGQYYARRAGVAERVRFVRQDLFQTDLRQHNVVMLYLSVALNRRLLPKLRAELPRGARIVSHKFDMGGDWLPTRTLQVDGVPIYLWIAPGPGA